ncbi:universal stress protein in QAH/OAS sulfhydrylase 3'region-like [Rhopilema esculentum]|uniref:universal stress protein in QAH/OAS sulfhydrylase 3'region-like n=1 Tax=Rhopilema esculentum TaxID=499914 RepID=UPI0031DF62C4|eukprot:gene866-10615_t
MSRSIVLAVDGSNIAEMAFCWYLSNLYRDGDEVNVICVHDMSEVEVPYILGPEPIVIPDTYEEAIRESYEKSKKLLSEYKKRLEEKSVKSVGHLRTSHGSAGSEICKLAEESKADCIVMGSRGLGTIRRTFLGSTSDYVLHHSDCPVLIWKQHHAVKA